ncbi:hypothetical protein DKX38_018082 [Salix brachista]|uniref:Uncharacterized protein n=1 Tax=Salix brachista TaxID=2182728 RepID=A0A5N5KY34_9ROSI|nr:hypothetical protein DKX38_018082 [Salix brachista]
MNAGDSIPAQRPSGNKNIPKIEEAGWCPIESFCMVVGVLLHGGDHDRASSYFERGVQASPEDCHVHAAYASFLWETEDGDDVDGDVPTKDFDAKPPHFLEGAVAFARG